MKTKIIAIAALIMLTITLAKAKDPQSTLRQTITEQIKFPSSAVDQKIEGVVFVEFTVSTDGKIEVINCNSLQGELQTYVYEVLSETKVTPDREIAGKTFLMRFDFKLI